MYALYILSKPEVADALGVCERTKERMVEDGLFPRPLALGSRRVWSREDVELFVRCGGSIHAFRRAKRGD